MIADYEQEWTVSSIYLQTNTKLHVETITYQHRYQLQILEKCKYNYLFFLLINFFRLL